MFWCNSDPEVRFSSIDAGESNFTFNVYRFAILLATQFSRPAVRYGNPAKSSSGISRRILPCDLARARSHPVRAQQFRLIQHRLDRLFLQVRRIAVRGDFGGGGGFAEARDVGVCAGSAEPQLGIFRHTAKLGLGVPGSGSITAPGVVGGGYFFEVGFDEGAADVAFAGLVGTDRRKIRWRRGMNTP